MENINKKINTSIENNEVDLKGVFIKIWYGKWLVFFSLIIFFLLGIQYYLNSPKIYSSRAIFGFKGENRKQFIPENFNFLGNFTGIDNESNEIIVSEHKKLFNRTKTKKTEKKVKRK